LTWWEFCTHFTKTPFFSLSLSLSLSFSFIYLFSFLFLSSFFYLFFCCSFLFICWWTPTLKPGDSPDMQMSTRAQRLWRQVSASKVASALNNIQLAISFFFFLLQSHFVEFLFQKQKLLYRKYLFIYIYKDVS